MSVLAAVSLAELRARTRERADETDSEFIDDDSLDDLLASGYRELVDLIVDAYEDYFTTSESKVVSSGNTIPLTSLSSTLYKLRGVDKDMGSNDWVRIEQYGMTDRNLFRTTRRWNPWAASPIPRYRMIGTALDLQPTDIALGTYRVWYDRAVEPMTIDQATVNGVRIDRKNHRVAAASITMTHTAGGALAVAVTGTAITVTYVTGVTTRQDIVDAINVSADAGTLVKARVGTFPGSAVVSANLGPTALTAGVDMDPMILRGWEEYIIAAATIQMKVKAEKETASVEQAKMMLAQRIIGVCKSRDAGEPEVMGFTAHRGYLYGEEEF